MQGWNADHIQAYATGGPTDVFNGQALCPDCNRQKGTSNMTIRDWQERFLSHFKNRSPEIRDYLLAATPGSGKTHAAIRASAELLRGRARRLVVVVPTEALKYQWAKKAAGMIALNPIWSGDHPESSTYQGLVVTYQSLASQQHMHRQLCARKSTAVIFDEQHHLGEGTWGEAAQTAFGGAEFRLGLSGTPFRSDGVRIPFVHYEPVDDKPNTWQSIADFTYGYADAIRDKVCRVVHFPMKDGSAHWIGCEGEQQATLLDELPPSLDRERMWALLNPAGDYMRTLCRQANEKLSDCRKAGHRNAGGLIIASDREAAERYKRLIESVTNERADLVISDHEEATSIDAFRESDRRWLVAVRMVSEGVDIDRLAVLVYATDWRAPLFFRQAVGRVVRMSEGVKLQRAFVFLPNHPELRALAQEIEDEIAHVLEEPKRRQPQERTPGERTENGTFHVLETAAEDADTISTGATFSADQISYARDLRQRVGITEAHDEQIAALLFLHDHEERSEKSPPCPEPEYEQEQRLRRECNAMAFKLSKLLSVEVQKVHNEWMASLGGSRQAQAPVKELERKYAWLTQRLADQADSAYR